MKEKDKDIIRTCLTTMLAITRGETNEAIKARKDISKTIENFNIFSKRKNYLVLFAGNEGLDSIKVSITPRTDKNIEIDDIQLISHYISKKYGYKDYEVIALDMLGCVEL